MSRLTRYNEKQKQYTRLVSRLAVDNTLGKIEDLMEKYEIESIEKLEEILNFYNEIEKHIVEDGRLVTEVEIEE